MKLHYIIVLFGTGIIIITLFTAFAFAKNEKPGFYKYIIIYIFLGLFLSINTYFNSTSIGLISKISRFFQEFMLLVQFLMLSLFFGDLLNKSKFIKKIRILFSLSILLNITLIVALLSTNVDIKPSIISSLFLLIYSFFYIKDLMNNKPTLILVKSPAFWIVMGTFFHSCVIFPVCALVPFIPKNDEYISLRNQIFSIFNISLIVLYLFIIKSYLCLKHPQNL